MNQLRAQETVTYGFVDTPYGEALAGKTPAGLCWFSFVMSGRDEAVSVMTARLKAAQYLQDDRAVADWRTAPLDMKGTAFQEQVWRALQDIPAGQTVSYQDIATRTGRPKAVRAVGSAVGANPVSLRIPCHRVIRSDGGLGGYAWGITRKESILKAEGATFIATPAAA